MKRRRFIQSRTASIDMDLTMRDNAWNETFRLVQTEREVRMTLAPEQRWPDECKRGRSVDFELGVGGDIYRMSGRVRFRRLNVCVITGRLERAA